jgi:hypothetical protein
VKVAPNAVSNRKCEGSERMKKKFKFKFGFQGQLASLLNTTTHVILPFASGALFTVAFLKEDTISLIAGMFILIPICFCDVTFEEENGNHES